MTGLKDEDIIDPDDAKTLLLNPDAPLERRTKALFWIDDEDPDAQEAVYQLATGPLERGAWRDALLPVAGSIRWEDDGRKAVLAPILFHGALDILEENRLDDPSQDQNLQAILRASLVLRPGPLTGDAVNPLLPILRHERAAARKGALAGLLLGSVPIPAETETVGHDVHAELAHLAEALLSTEYAAERFAQGVHAFLAAALLDAPTIAHLTPERIGNARKLGLERCSTELSAFLQCWINCGVPEPRRTKLAALATAFEAARPAFGIGQLRESRSIFFGKLA
jgi:hypothetical protein